MSSSQPCKRSQNQPEPPASLLTSIKSLVRRPWQASSSSSRRLEDSRPRTSAGHNRSKSPELDWDLQPNSSRQTVERRQSHPLSPMSNSANNNQSGTINQQYHPATNTTTTTTTTTTHRRRGRRPHGQDEVNSMADYLTLAQLENFWQQQDRRRADQAAPTTTTTTNGVNSRAERALPPRGAGGAPADTQLATALQPPPVLSCDIHPALKPRPSHPEGLRIITNSKPSKNVHPPWGSAR